MHPGTTLGKCQLDVQLRYIIHLFVTYIKIKRLKWAGHVILMEEQSPARRVVVAVVEGRRQRDRLKPRWKDGVMEDARKLRGEKLEECCKE